MIRAVRRALADVKFGPVVSFLLWFLQFVLVAVAVVPSVFESSASPYFPLPHYVLQLGTAALACVWLTDSVLDLLFDCDLLVSYDEDFFHDNVDENALGDVGARDTVARDKFSVELEEKSRVEVVVVVGDGETETTGERTESHVLPPILPCSRSRAEAGEEHGDSCTVSSGGETVRLVYGLERWWRAVVYGFERWTRSRLHFEIISKRVLRSAKSLRHRVFGVQRKIDHEVPGYRAVHDVFGHPNVDVLLQALTASFSSGVVLAVLGAVNLFFCLPDLSASMLPAALFLTFGRPFPLMDMNNYLGQSPQEMPQLSSGAFDHFNSPMQGQADFNPTMSDCGGATAPTTATDPLRLPPGHLGGGSSASATEAQLAAAVSCCIARCEEAPFPPSVSCREACAHSTNLPPERFACPGGELHCCQYRGDSGCPPNVPVNFGGRTHEEFENCLELCGPVSWPGQCDWPCGLDETGFQISDAGVSSGKYFGDASGLTAEFPTEYLEDYNPIDGNASITPTSTGTDSYIDALGSLIPSDVELVRLRVEVDFLIVVFKVVNLFVRKTLHAVVIADPFMSPPSTQDGLDVLLICFYLMKLFLMLTDLRPPNRFRIVQKAIHYENWIIDRVFAHPWRESTRYSLTQEENAATRSSAVRTDGVGASAEDDCGGISVCGRTGGGTGGGGVDNCSTLHRTPPIWRQLLEDRIARLSVGVALWIAVGLIFAAVEGGIVKTALFLLTMWLAADLL